MNREMETALALRGLLKGYKENVFVRFSGKRTGTEDTVFSLHDSHAGDILYSSFIKAEGDLTVEIKGEGVYRISPVYNRSAEGMKSSGVAVVTGGAQGFGAGLAESLIQKGYLVYAADINSDAAEAFAEEQNRKAGYTAAVGIKVNVADEESVKNMIEKIVTDCGGLDVFISNAGVLKAGSVKEMRLENFSFVTDVDYTGFFLCTKYASRAMSIMNKYAQGNTTDIIQINSKSGLEGSKKNGAYAGAKFGSIGLVQSFALELVEDRIKVNAVCPGNFLDGPLWSDPDRGLFVQYLKTGKVPGAETIEDVRKFYEGKVPMKRGCTISDVVKAVYYIIDQEYETGQALPVTGGQIMMH